MYFSFFFRTDSYSDEQLMGKVCKHLTLPLKKKKLYEVLKCPMANDPLPDGEEMNGCGVSVMDAKY